jgi:deglycase
MKTLNGKKVAILTDNGFEEEELTSPKRALEEAGATVHIVSMQRDKVKAWNHDHWSIEIPVDENLEEANAEDYDALMIPGGVINSDQMRRQKDYVDFARAFFVSGKPVAAICHAPQLLIETGLLDGKNLTSFYSIKTDLINAGAHWHDEEVVTDNGLVTSRSPKDLPFFNKKMIEEIAEGIHERKESFASSL